MKSQPTWRVEHSWRREEGAEQGVQGWVVELLTPPMGSGGSLSLLEQGNYRPRAQKGWGGTYWRQGEQPEIQGQRMWWFRKEKHERQGDQVLSALEKSEEIQREGGVKTSSHGVTLAHVSKANLLPSLSDRNAFSSNTLR